MSLLLIAVVPSAWAAQTLPPATQATTQSATPPTTQASAHLLNPPTTQGIIAVQDDVVSAIECKVADPGPWATDLGVTAGQTLRIETLRDQVSSIFLDGQPLMSAFPAALSFDTGFFKMQGREPHADGAAWLTLDVRGRLAAAPFNGFLLMIYADADSRYRAQVRLQNCRRVL